MQRFVVISIAYKDSVCNMQHAIALNNNRLPVICIFIFQYEDSGIGELFSHCIDMFSIDCSPLLNICASLAIASDDSCTKVRFISICVSNIVIIMRIVVKIYATTYEQKDY